MGSNRTGGAGGEQQLGDAERVEQRGAVQAEVREGATVMLGIHEGIKGGG